MIDPTTDLQYLVDEYLFERKGTREGHHRAMLKRFVIFSTSNRIPLCQVTVKDIEAFIGYLHQAGYTLEYIAVNFVFLRIFFDQLQADGLIHGNPARDVYARAGRNEFRRFTNEELVKFITKYHPRA